MNRPIAGPLNDTGIDESTDAYDTIDWLVKNMPEVERQGRRHRLVLSRLHHADGRDQSASRAQGGGAAKPDGRRLDGRRLVSTTARSASASFDYRGRPEHRQGRRRRQRFARGEGDDYTRYLEAGSVGGFRRRCCGIDQYPGRAQSSCENPAYTEFWSLQAVDKWLAAQPLTVPTMLEVGQWDQEDSYGAPAVYRALEPKDKNNDMVSLVHRAVAAFGRQPLRLRPGRADLHRRHRARMAAASM